MTGALWRPPTSDQSRASHSGGQLWLLQGSVREGRRGVQAKSSRTFSSVTEILLLHKTSRDRRPLLQLRLHSDHSPVHQLEVERSRTLILFFIHYITVRMSTLQSGQRLYCTNRRHKCKFCTHKGKHDICNKHNCIIAQNIEQDFTQSHGMYRECDKCLDTYFIIKLKIAFKSLYYLQNVTVAGNDDAPSKQISLYVSIMVFNQIHKQ